MVASSVISHTSLESIEDQEQWAFYSQLGRIFDAFTELKAVRPQAAFSEVDYLFPQCEMVAGSDAAAMNDIVAQLLSPFVNSAWMDEAGLLRRTYRWDDPLMARFSNRATLAQIVREQLALAA